MAKHEVVTTLYAETVATRNLPVNFDQDHLSLFKHELERKLPQIRLLKFRDVRVSAEGLLFSGLKILPESFAFPNHLDQWKRRSIVKFLFTNYLSRRPRRVEDDVLWITDYWSREYFHWIADALSRLFVVRDRLNDLVLILPSGYEHLDYVRSSLKAFDVKHVEFIKREETLHCRSLLLPTHAAPSGHYNADVIHGVRDVLLSAYGDSSDRGERIYISRHDATKRRIANEDEVESILHQFGFETIRAEDLSFVRQVQTFSRARYIVSNHGAGLTNMLFMKGGGSVLELRHRLDHINNCYFTLSSALNLNYFYQTCEPSSADTDPHTAHLIVDPRTLESNLRIFTNLNRL
ncbi:MAG TPA: glycosyltransferase family 61 protein [Pyrinomonadaceae bacterium]|nr:glycosyltransferase family 61 protein [Pyrinomonadaceae bacterium]